MRQVYQDQGRRWLCAVPLLAAVACTDDVPTGVTSSNALPRASVQASSAEWRTADIGSAAKYRFGEPQVEVLGTIKPGVPIQLRVTVPVQVTTQDVSLRIQLPEVAELNYTRQYGKRPAAPFTAPDHVRWVGAVEAGGSAKQLTSVVFPRPGLYRVRLFLSSSDPAELDGWPVQNVALKEVWFWLTSNGGRYVGDVKDVFADPQIRGKHATTMQLAAYGCEEDPYAFECQDPDPPAPILFGVATYFNQRLQRQTALPNALIVIFDTSDPGRYNAATYTDDAGTFSFPCPPPEVGANPQIVLTTDNDIVITEWANGPGGPPRDVAYYTGISSDYCGWEVPIASMLPAQTEVFDNVAQTWLRSFQFFGRARSEKLRVRFNSGAQFNAFYAPAGDSIRISEPGAGGPRGLFTAAHEYGHAAHEKAFGGLNQQTSCGSNLWSANIGLGCAWIEGFATYHAVALWGPAADESTTVPDANTPYAAVAGNWAATSNGTGPAALGPVASTLFYLGGERSNPTARLRPPSMIVDAMINCRVEGNRVDGIDFLMHCFEERQQHVVSPPVGKYPATESFYQYIDHVAHGQYFAPLRGNVSVLNWQWTWPGHGSGLWEGYLDIRALWRCTLFLEECGRQRVP